MVNAIRLIEAPTEFRFPTKTPRRLIPLSDPDWPRRVAEKYGFPVDLSKGEFYWTRDSKRRAGYCMYLVPDRWEIHLSYDRLEAEGWDEAEQTLAHELLHAWLFELSGAGGHGPIFDGICRKRGIKRYCAVWESVEARPQPALF